MRPRAHNALGKAVEGGGKVGVFALGVGILQRFKQSVKMGPRGFGRQVGSDAAVEGYQAHGVALAQHQVGERGSGIGGVLKFGEAIRAVGH